MKKVYNVASAIMWIAIMIIVYWFFFTGSESDFRLLSQYQPPTPQEVHQELISEPVTEEMRVIMGGSTDEEIKKGHRDYNRRVVDNVNRQILASLSPIQNPEYYKINDVSDLDDDKYSDIRKGIKIESGELLTNI